LVFEVDCSVGSLRREREKREREKERERESIMRIWSGNCCKKVFRVRDPPENSENGISDKEDKKQ
jgi:hypothetical protein